MSRVERGLIYGFDAATWTADVELVESGHMVLPDVPVAWSVDSTQIVAGSTHCVLLLSDDLSPSRSVVLALYQGVAPDLELEFG